jgi:glutamate dehydrogenase (NAD(P)+)
MVDAFRRVSTVASDMHLPMRTAAFVVACRRVLEARSVLGLYP